MKRTTTIVLSGLVFIFCFCLAAFASFDPPHNESSNVGCGDCHDPLLELLDSNGEPIDHPLWDTGISTDEAYNAICLRCHVTDPTLGNYGGSSAPLVKSHAPNGTPIKCIKCHHNHYQEQLDIGNYNKDNFFIAKGTGSALSYSNGETVIQVTSIRASNPTSAWASDLNKLANKTEIERGALLVPRRSYSASRWPMFTIKSISITPKTGDDNTGTVDGTITVKGNVSDTAELKARVADFGIFYGQQLRGIMEITPGNYSYMEFYDRTGANSLVNLTPPYGICQVCHENPGASDGIKYWRNDGTGNSHNTGSNCMGCHLHTKGINHYAGNDCNTCHDAHHSTSNASAGNCEYCHADPRPSMIYWDDLLPGDNGNNYGTFVPTQMACKECHVNFSNGKMEVYKFTRTNYVTYVENYGREVIHEVPAVTRINNYGICFSCHNGSIAAAVTVWHARPDMHDSSWVYNDPNGDTQRCTGGRDGDLIPDPPPMPESWARFIAGRSSGTIGSFNLFQDPGFGYTPQTGGIDNDPCTDWANYTTPGTAWSFTRIAIPAVPGNGNTSGSVPVFPSLCPMTPDGEECPPAPPPPDATITFNYTGSTQTYDIPANATNIQLTVNGAGGGGGRPDFEGFQTAGQSGSKVVLPYGNPGLTLSIYVGKGGNMGSATSTGAPGGWGYPSSGSKGGNGEDDGEDWAYGGAGGGGASSVYYGGTKLAVARGGAGGRSDDYDGMYDYYIGGSGGAGGGANFYPSGTLYFTGGGAGGTTVPTNGGNGQVIITYNVSQ